MSRREEWRELPTTKTARQLAKVLDAAKATHRGRPVVVRVDDWTKGVRFTIYAAPRKSKGERGRGPLLYQRECFQWYARHDDLREWCIRNLRPGST